MHSIRTGAIALAGCVALACGPSKTKEPVQTTTAEGKTTSPAGTAAERRGTTLIRVVNALPSKLSIDVGGDDRVLFSNVGYQVVTDFEQLRDNVTRFTVRVNGKDSVLADNREAMGDGAPGIIASAQRVEHYEIAAYGCAISFAQALGHTDIVTMLEETLAKEKAADEKLSAIAEEEVNQHAIAAGAGSGNY
jgi:hypothetical protein